MITAVRTLLGRLRRAQDGVAMVEFAYSLVVVVPLFLGGVELSNYVTTKMRVSQLALHVADNASRMGIDSLLAAPRITEGQISDLLIGADLQSGSLDLASKGRVILSSVERMPSPDEGQHLIRWQRCYGAMDWDSTYGDAGDDEIDAVGPVGEQITAPANTGVMFVEIAYQYEPLFLASTSFTNRVIHETAAMVVRDDRDYLGPGGAGVYSTSGVTPATC